MSQTYSRDSEPNSALAFDNGRPICPKALEPYDPNDTCNDSYIIRGGYCMSHGIRELIGFCSLTDVPGYWSKNQRISGQWGVAAFDERFYPKHNETSRLEEELGLERHQYGYFVLTGLPQETLDSVRLIHSECFTPPPEPLTDRNGRALVKMYQKFSDAPVFKAAGDYPYLETESGKLHITDDNWLEVTDTLRDTSSAHAYTKGDTYIYMFSCPCNEALKVGLGKIARLKQYRTMGWEPIFVSPPITNRSARSIEWHLLEGCGTSVHPTMLKEHGWTMKSGQSETREWKDAQRILYHCHLIFRELNAQ